MSQRCVLLLTSLLGELLHKTNYLNSGELIQLFEIGDSLITKFGNDAYASISTWESIIIGFLLQSSPDPLTNNKKFHEEMALDFIGSQLHEDSEFLTNYLKDKIYQFLNQLSTPSKLMQAFGLYRIWGHPTINQKSGIDKLKSVACRPRAMDEEMIKLVTNKWREYFFINYHRNTQEMAQYGSIKDQLSGNMWGN